MDSRNIVARVKGMLTAPRTEWPVAASEPATTGGLYAGYIAILAAIPAIATFIKTSLIGYSLFGVTVRAPIGAGIAHMVLGYVLSLVVVYIVALIVNALAPTFGGQKDQVQALKTVAYAWTASWIAGAFTIVPWLGWLVVLAGAIYAIYLLYLGLPNTMKCPVDKAAGYTAVTVIIAIVLSWIVGMVLAGLIGGAAMSGAHLTTGHGAGDSVSFDKDSTLGQLAAIGKQSGEAGSVEALPPDRIKALLPDSVDDMKRASTSAERNNGMGMHISVATARYAGDDGQGITLEVADTGSARGLVAMAAALAPEEDKQTDHGYEKTYSADGRIIHEQWDTASKSGEYSVVIAKRFTVKATGNTDDIKGLKQAVEAVDLDQLESMKDEGVKND